MRAISSDDLKRFNAEQIAGLTLSILQDNFNKSNRVSYYEGQLSSILAFEINPKWLGKNVVNGCEIMQWGVQSYGGERAPQQLQTLFNNGIDILQREGLIQQDPTQTHSSDFVILTDKGRVMKTNSKFELNICRNPHEIIEKYKRSTFLMETRKGDKISCGTCFLLEGNLIVTCKHNVEDRNFSIAFDNDTVLDDTTFNTKLHNERDIAILTLKSKRMANILCDFQPLVYEEDDEVLLIGEQLITMGYPLVSLREPQLLADIGTFQNYTQSYLDHADYLTFSNRIDGGCSGGPVISLKGKLVGVITESTEQSTDSSGQKVVARGSSIYGHGTPAKYIFTY